MVFTHNRSEIKSTKEGYFPTIHSLYSMIPMETREHMERVGNYCEKLFRTLYEEQPEMIEAEFGENFLAFSREIFKYHDIGRYYIPISILNKVGKLTDEEFETIRNHTKNAIPAIESLYKFPYPADVMEQWKEIAVFHHERWDGNGYPYGLKEKEIPLGARICAIGDTYDGITSWKPYKDRQTTKEEALLIIAKESEKQFDPYLVDVFRTCMYDNKK